MDQELPPLERSVSGPYVDAYLEGGRHYNVPLIVGIVLFAMIGFYAAVAVVSQLDEDYLPGNEFPNLPGISSLPGVQDTECSKEGATQRTNTLVMGLDLRRDEPDDTPARTDTVFVMTMEACSKTAGILSIPRDTLVDIPDGYGDYVADRINTAYERGEMREKGSGPQLAMETIEHNFDIPIDYYAVLNFNNFIEIIDELGGITVDVPEYVYDGAYSDCNACYAYPVEFEPGVQDMDGETALAYVRLRKSDNDFKRIERQQIVMRAMASKLAGLKWLAEGKAPSLYSKYKDSVKTNLPDSRIPGLALLGSQIGVDNIRMESLAEAVYPCPYSLCGGAAMLLTIPEKVEEVKNRIFGDPRLQQEGAVVKIINGTPAPDFAAQFADYLRTQGIDSDHVIVDELANGLLYNTTLVIDLDGKDYTVEKLGEWLNLPQTRLKNRDELTSGEISQYGAGTASVLVVLGADAVLPQIEQPEPEYTDDYYTDPGEEIFGEETPIPEETEAPVFIPTPSPEPITTPEPEPTEEPEPEPTQEPQPTEAAGMPDETTGGDPSLRS